MNNLLSFSAIAIFSIIMGMIAFAPAMASHENEPNTTSNDLLPTITINDVTKTEGNFGKQYYFFKITRSDNLTPISLQYKTTDGTASSSDYNTKSLKKIYFQAGGKLNQLIAVTVNSDAEVEPDETFFVDLSNCTNCIIADYRGVGTITNDDLVEPTPDDNILPTITISDVTLTEDNSGKRYSIFTITRSDNLTPISVQHKTTDGTASSSSDYDAKLLTKINFQAGGKLNQLIAVTVNSDTEVEPDETFFVDLSNCIGCTTADSRGVGTITNDDLVEPTPDDNILPTITISDPILSESNSGTKDFGFTITRSDNIGKISLQYKTTDGTASSSSDYTAISLTTVKFSAGGSLSKTIIIPVKGDTEIETDETFFVDLSNCTNCEITDSQGIITIKDDDSFPSPSSTRPILITMVRGEISNEQELVDVFKKYTNPGDLKFGIKFTTNSFYDQLDLNEVKFAGSIEKMTQKLSRISEGTTHLGYDPEWFENIGGTPEAEYKDYVNSVITASNIAHDNGLQFVLTPLYKDIQNHAKEFAPYVDVTVLQIPHLTRNYAIEVETAVQDIKSINPDALVMVQLIPRDSSIKQNGDPAEIIEAYNSVRDHVDGVLLFYYDGPNPVPVIEEFYQGIGIPAN